MPLNDDLEKKMDQRRTRKSLVLWWSPVWTIYYFLLELLHQLRSCISRYALEFSVHGGLQLSMLSLYIYHLLINYCL